MNRPEQKQSRCGTGENGVTMIIKEEIKGSIIVNGDIAAIRLAPPESKDVVYVAYALFTQGPEYQILPSVLVDDWGNEIAGMQLYDWIKENGLQFPRAEVFGVTPSGGRVQYFLRDLELFEKFPVYAFSDADADDASGIAVQAILVPDETVSTYEACSPLEGLSPMLARGQLAWWCVNPQINSLEFLS